MLKPISQAGFNFIAQIIFIACVHCAVVLTEQGAGVSEGSDLRVRQASEQRQQGGEEELVINQAILTRPHQDLSKLAQARFETPQLGARGAQRVVCRILDRAENTMIRH